MRDLGNNILPTTSIAPADRTASVNGTAVALKGYGEYLALITAGALAIVDGSNYFTAKVQTGDQADGSDAADIAATDYINPIDQTGAAWDYKLDAAGDANKSFQFGFVNSGNKKYARVVMTETGTAQQIFGATIQLGRPAHAPV